MSYLKRLHKQLTGVVRLVGMLPVLLLAAPAAIAHDAGLSAMEVRIGREAITAQLRLANSDLDALIKLDRDHDGRVDAEEFSVSRTALESLAQRSLELMLDGQVISAASKEALMDDDGSVLLRSTFRCSAGSGLIIRSLLIDRLPRGHRQFVSVIDSSEAILMERLLDSANVELDVLVNQAKEPGGLTSVRRFVLLGVEHILAGYDHIAFLVGLLLVCASFKEALTIVSSFTLAHSVTLALAALDVFNISPAIVEPLIAASIVYVGIENLKASEMKQRWLVTFCFGLVHGFGFASVLKELRIGMGASKFAALLSFNSGVELGQIAIVAIVLPIIWRLRRRERIASRLVPACSILIVLFGSYWLVQRLQS